MPKQDKMVSIIVIIIIIIVLSKRQNKATNVKAFETEWYLF